MSEVVFVVPPFADIESPAAGVSILKALAGAAGFDSSIEYASLAFAEKIGAGIYNLLAADAPPEALAGERVFAEALFEGQIPDLSTYCAEISSQFDLGGKLESILGKAIGRADELVEETVRRVLERKPRLVGFTTSFQQNCASLAIARRLSESPAPPLIVFGGSNCEGPMGQQLLRSFPFIDFVANGEAEAGFNDFLRFALRGEGSLPRGFLSRQQQELTPPVRLAMDDIPVPDYDDYFQRLEGSPLRKELNPLVPIETARGCWWGAVHHCTFCGLNGGSMAFRSKSPERAFSEFSTLPARYGVKRVNGVDNILDLRYLKTLVPRLAEARLDLDIFYEVKANLRFDQVQALAQAGIRRLQPGIESFSDEVLALMRKGCTGAQNLQLLRWSGELSVEILYNVIFGFPGETDGAYQQMLDALPLLHHLQPPMACSQIRLDRFSPYFENPAAFAMERVRPARAYYFVYPLPRGELARLGYFFEFDRREVPAGVRRKGELARAVAAWGKASRAGAMLEAAWTRDGCTVRDTRAVAVAPLHQLTGLAARVYRLCDTAQSAAGLRSRLGAPGLEAVLRDLTERRLLLESGGRFASLATFRDRAAWAGEAGRRHEPAQAEHRLRLAVLD